MHKNAQQYNIIFQIWNKIIIKQNKNSQLRVSCYWSSGEQVFTKIQLNKYVLFLIVI